MSELSIINVSINGLTAAQCVSAVNKRLESIDKSVFNLAILGAYATGITIPKHVDAKGNVHGEAVCDKPMKPKDFYALVNRDHSTFSRWIGALKYTIDEGDFNNFASGMWQFNYDKIHMIYPNLDKLKDYERADLLKMSKSSIKALLATNDSDSESESESESEDPSTIIESTITESEPTTPEKATFTYNGVDYTVDKALIEELIAKAEVVNK